MNGWSVFGAASAIMLATGIGWWIDPTPGLHIAFLVSFGAGGVGATLGQIASTR